MITQIEIQHYKSIDQLDLTLNNQVICVGKNASGKSNFLDAISFLGDIANDGIDTALMKRHGYKSVCQWSKFKPYDLSIGVKVSGRSGKGAYRIQLSPKNETYFVKAETGRWDWIDREGQAKSSSFSRNAKGELRFRGVSIFDRHSKSDGPNIIIEKDETFLHALSSRSIYGNLYSLWREVASIVSYKIFPNVVREPELPISSDTLRGDGSNICRIFKNLTKNSRDNKAKRLSILSGMKHAISDLDNVLIKNTGEYLVPFFSVFDDTGRKKTHQFNASQMSDGSLRLFALLVALYQPMLPRKIGLEEPEQNINPALVSILCDSIKDVSSESQIFVTSHSPQLIDEFPIENIVAFNFSKGVSDIGRVEAAQVEIVKKGLMSLGELAVSDQIRLEHAN